MPDTKLIAQVAVVGTKVDHLTEDFKSFKEAQEAMWKVIRKNQERNGDNESKMIALLHKAENERVQIRHDLSGNKKLCDDRFEAIEKNKKIRIERIENRQKVRLGFATVVIASCVNFAFKVAERYL